MNLYTYLNIYFFLQLTTKNSKLAAYFKNEWIV